MIKTDNFELNGRQLVRHYSDTGHMIRQIETGVEYSEAVDVSPCRYTYEETATLLPDNELSAQEALDIITGEEV